MSPRCRARRTASASRVDAPEYRCRPARKEVAGIRTFTMPGSGLRVWSGFRADAKHPTRSPNAIGAVALIDERQRIKRKYSQEAPGVRRKSVPGAIVLAVSDQRALVMGNQEGHSHEGWDLYDRRCGDRCARCRADVSSRDPSSHCDLLQCLQARRVAESSRWESALPYLSQPAL